MRPFIDLGAPGAEEPDDVLRQRLSLHHPPERHRLPDEDVDGVEVRSIGLLLHGRLEDLDREPRRRDRRQDLRLCRSGIELGQKDRGHPAAAEPLHQGNAGLAIRGRVDELRSSLRQVTQLEIGRSQDVLHPCARLSHPARP
jgi:hypothetical protein